jgi:hypothetical protein
VIGDNFPNSKKMVNLNKFMQDILFIVKHLLLFLIYSSKNEGGYVSTRFSAHSCSSAYALALSGR